jgi:hypothetical protein
MRRRSIYRCVWRATGRPLAAKVLDHLEEWLQTEWPGLRVSCTSVTEQWAVAAVNGPLAREVVAATVAGVDLSNEAFPAMTWREGRTRRGASYGSSPTSGSSSASPARRARPPPWSGRRAETGTAVLVTAGRRAMMTV